MRAGLRGETVAEQGGLIGGVDEAGRGCVLGPLVVAGISIRSERLEKLRSIGVKDSKKLTPKKRAALYPKILRLCETVASSNIYPDEIDKVVKTGVKLKKLNYLEAVYFAKVVDRLGAQRVTVDASDVIPSRFRDNIVERMSAHSTVVAVHKADRDFVAVSAASIVAKVRRDRAVAKLRKLHGEFGSGYPSDPSTREFFLGALRSGYPLPDYVRKSWKTWDRLSEQLQTTLVPV